MRMSDWSSDVCSSDLPPGPGLAAHQLAAPALTGTHFITGDGTLLPLRTWAPPEGTEAPGVLLAPHGFNDYSNAFAESGPALAAAGLRSEQRSVGQEWGSTCRSRWLPYN